MSEWYPATSAPKSILTKSPAARTASVGRWCGIAELAPAATIVSKDTPSAPWSSIRDSSSRPTSFSVRPGRRPPVDQVRQRGVGRFARQPEQRDLTCVLDLAQRLDHARRPDQFDVAGRLREQCVTVHGHDVALEPQPADPPAAARAVNPARTRVR